MDLNARCVRAQAIIEYEFDDVAHLQEALTAAGNPRLNGDGRTNFHGNASLAFIGDGLIRVKVGVASQSMGSSKGDTNATWKNTASNNNLAGKCKNSGLAVCIVPAPGTRSLQVSTRATAIEAVIGAVFLDSGYEAASRVMATLGVE